MTCEACSVQQAAARLKEATAKLLTDGLLRPRGTLQLAAEPAAATVRLGEHTLGPLPYQETLWAGSYEVTASHPGYQSIHQRVEIKDGKAVALHLLLQRSAEAVAVPGPTAPKKTGRAPRPRWRLALGGTLLESGWR